MSVEARLDEWAKQAPGLSVTGPERMFIAMMRAARAQGVGYGWMQQVIEWEWQAKGIAGGAWGPEFFRKRIEELESRVPPESPTNENGSMKEP